jgi:hypothetical protein
MVVIPGCVFAGRPWHCDGKLHISLSGRCVDADNGKPLDNVMLVFVIKQMGESPKAKDRCAVLLGTFHDGEIKKEFDIFYGYKKGSKRGLSNPKGTFDIEIYCEGYNFHTSKFNFDEMIRENGVFQIDLGCIEMKYSCGVKR